MPDLDDALRALSDKPGTGPLVRRLETAVDEETDAALDALAVELGNIRTKRSAAARFLMQKGARALLADRTASA